MSKIDFIKKASADYAATACAISDYMWDYPEVAYTEYKACEALVKALKDEGFEVEVGVAGIPTAFVAKWGNGKPVVGILAEYDALEALNQYADKPEKCEYSHGAPGQGCGHHMLGASSLAGAVIAKRYMEANGTTGTIVCYGCPAEEGGSGKTFMARDGVFDGCDIAIGTHPSDVNSVVNGSSLANVKIRYIFDGRASHAAGDPEKGRSAYDALELMNIGVQFLREHVIQEARIHYAVTDTGGEAPNVVQAHAEQLYMIRAPKIDQVMDIYRRINLIANGAAMMTETTCTIQFIKGCSNLLANKVVGRQMHKALVEIGVPEYTEEEFAWAEQYVNTVGNSGLDEASKKTALKYATPEEKEALVASFSKPICDVVFPFDEAGSPVAGSTDVSDVSMVAPCTYFGTATWVLGSPGHSWQNVAQGKSSVAHKGMLYAGEVLAKVAIDFMEDPELVKAAKAEHEEAMEGKPYVCPIPKDVPAPVPATGDYFRINKIEL